MDTRTIEQIPTKRVFMLSVSEEFIWSGLEWFVVSKNSNFIRFCRIRYGGHISGSRTLYKNFGRWNQMKVEVIKNKNAQ